MRKRGTPSIAVVGAGIGGLAVAAALRQVGLDATVYEQAKAFARVGAGIQQSPNAVKIHRGLGIEDRLRAVAFAPTSALNREAITGKVTNDHPWGRAVEERYGAPYLTLHRGDLHVALADIVPAQSIVRGKKLVRIGAPGPRVELTFADSSEVEADIVIYYVTAARDEIYFTTSVPERADWMTRESWSAKGDLAEMRAAFAHFHSEAQEVLAAAPEVHKWGIYERDPLPRWSKGRAVLLGDACHPMTPYMASGAAMALEDAVVLARCLADEDYATPEAAFRIYEATRKPRASTVQAGSSANTWMRNETNPDWLYGYDACRVPLRSEAAALASTYWEA